MIFFTPEILQRQMNCFCNLRKSSNSENPDCAKTNKLSRKGSVFVARRAFLGRESGLNNPRFIHFELSLAPGFGSGFNTSLDVFV